MCNMSFLICLFTLTTCVVECLQNLTSNSVPSLMWVLSLGDVFVILHGGKESITDSFQESLLGNFLHT